MALTVFAHYMGKWGLMCGTPGHLGRFEPLEDDNIVVLSNQLQGHVEELGLAEEPEGRVQEQKTLEQCIQERDEAWEAAKSFSDRLDEVNTGNTPWNEMQWARIVRLESERDEARAERDKLLGVLDEAQQDGEMPLMDGVVAARRELREQLEAERDAARAALAEYAKELLYQLIRNISQECYCAGWMVGIEYRLWEMIAHPNRSRAYGMGVVTDATLATLRQLSADAGGFWTRDADHKKQFVLIDQWLGMYVKHQEAEGDDTS